MFEQALTTPLNLRICAPGVLRSTRYSRELIQIWIKDIGDNAVHMTRGFLPRSDPIEESNKFLIEVLAISTSPPEDRSVIKLIYKHYGHWYHLNNLSNNQSSQKLKNWIV